MYLVFDFEDDDFVWYPPAEVWVKSVIDEWAKFYGMPYRTKRHKTQLRLILEKPEQYTFFLMTWQGFVLQTDSFIGDYMTPRAVNPEQH